VDVSIDGLEQGHDYLRGAGSYNLTKDNICAVLPALGSDRVTISTVACSHNLDEIPRLIEEFAKLGLKYFFIQPVQLLGRAAHFDHLRVSGAQYLRLLEELLSRDLQANALVEMYVDYPLKRFFYERCDLFRDSCRASRLNQPLAFKVPFGKLQLTSNWRCYAYHESCMITAFGQLLGCSAQAAASQAVGPSPGFVPDLTLRDLFSKSADNNSYDGFFRSSGGKALAENLNRVGIVNCPVTQRQRATHGNKNESNNRGCKESTWLR
jgi:MoaA/NifB/PqqE/SkfB family radical SAM enzyme